MVSQAPLKLTGGPCGPAGPVAPVKPAAPFGPAGPCGPMAPVAPTGPTTAQVVPVSPATQLAVEVTMRTTPVVELTHAETELDTGAAIAAIPAKSEEISTPPQLCTMLARMPSWFCLRGLLFMAADKSGPPSAPVSVIAVTSSYNCINICSSASAWACRRWFW